MDNIFVFDLEAATQNMVGGMGKVGSGVYPATVKGVFPGKTKNGNNEVDIVLDVNGQDVVIFSLCIDKNWVTGTENLNYPRWMEFAAISGMKTGQMGTAKRKLNGAIVDAPSFAEPIGKKIQVAIQVEHDVYQNVHREQYRLVKTFTEGGQTIQEAMEKKPAEYIQNFEVTDYETPEYKAAKLNGTLIEQNNSTASAASATPQTNAPQTAAPQPEVQPAVTETNDLF